MRLLTKIWSLHEEDSSNVLFINVPVSAIRIQCAVRKLQLAIWDCFKIKRIEKLIGISQAITRKLRTQLVMDALSVKGLKKPVMRVITRWNSTGDMLKRLLELKTFIQEDLKLLKSVQITESTWNKLEDLHASLQPLQILTTKLQAENLNIPQFVKDWKLAEFQLQKQQTFFASELLGHLKVRGNLIFSQPIIKAGQYIDIGLRSLMTCLEAAEAKETIKSIYKKKQRVEGAVILPDLDVDDNCQVTMSSKLYLGALAAKLLLTQHHWI